MIKKRVQSNCAFWESGSSAAFLLRQRKGRWDFSASTASLPLCLSLVVSAALPAQPRALSRECVDQPELANCDLILQAQLCGNEYYSSFCCASCSRVQPHAQPVRRQG